MSAYDMRHATHSLDSTRVSDVDENERRERAARQRLRRLHISLRVSRTVRDALASPNAPVVSLVV